MQEEGLKELIARKLQGRRKGMTWTRFWELFWCKMGFHDWEARATQKINTIDYGVKTEHIYLGRHCSVCPKWKRIRIP